ALISHEVLYAYLREFNGVTTSTRARQYVAFLFAGNQLQSIPSFTQDKLIEVCSTSFSSQNPAGMPISAFHTRRNADGTWTASFNVINGVSVLGKTEISGSLSDKGFSWPAAAHQSNQGTGNVGFIKPIFTSPL